MSPSKAAAVRHADADRGAGARRQHPLRAQRGGKIHAVPRHPHLPVRAALIDEGGHQRAGHRGPVAARHHHRGLRAGAASPTRSASPSCRSKSASLICDGVEMARNAEADEEVWKLLGIEPRSTRALDEAAYGILWVEQGHSFEMPEPSEGAKSVLNAVIQQEVGTLVGGERARLLLNSVKEELGRYLTDGPDSPRPMARSRPPAKESRAPDQRAPRRRDAACGRSTASSTNWTRLRAALQGRERSVRR